MFERFVHRKQLSLTEGKNSVNQAVFLHISLYALLPYPTQAQAQIPCRQKNGIQGNDMGIKGKDLRRAMGNPHKISNIRRGLSGKEADNIHQKLL